MAYLVSDVTARAREHLAAFYLDSDPLCLATVNEVHSKIVEGCRIYPTDTVTITLTAGTQEYPLDPDAFRIWSATYLGTSASDYTRLRETSIDELDIENPTWRNQPTGRPVRYYEEGGSIGLYPAPSTTTSAGYPNVSLVCSRRHAFVAVTDALPSHLENVDAWIFGVCERWCQRNRQDLLPTFQGLAKHSLDELRRYVDGRLVRQHARSIPSFPRVSNL